MADGRQLADFSLVDQPTIGLRLSGFGFRCRTPTRHLPERPNFSPAGVQSALHHLL